MKNTSTRRKLELLHIALAILQIANAVLELLQLVAQFYGGIKQGGSVRPI